MNKTGMIALILTTFVSVIMIGSVLVPVLDEETELHYTNAYGSSAEACTPSTTLSWTWDGTPSGGAYSWKVNGVEQTDFAYELVTSTPILLSDNIAMGINATNGVISNGASFNFSTDGVRAVVHAVRSATITFDTTTITAVLDTGTGPVTKTAPYTWAYCAVDDGDYRIVNGSRAPGKYYYESLEDIKCNGNSSSTWYTFDGSSGYVGANSATVNVDSVAVGQDLEYISYGLVANAWVSTLTLESAGTSYTPAFFAMPYQVDGHEEGITESMSNLFGIIPLMLIVAVIAGLAIRMVNARN